MRSYYTNARPELLDLIPIRTPKLLDIGCGAGVMAAAAKSKGVVSVYGVEREPTAAALAKRVVDDIIIGDIETVDIPWRDFDFIVCADILEHLREPWALLRRLLSHLSMNGKLIASIPNITHRSVVFELLRGRFDYRDEGILDRTHLRFFTRRSIREMFESCGYSVVAWHFKRSTGAIDKLIRIASLGATLDMTVVQHIVIATPNRRGVH